MCVFSLKLLALTQYFTAVACRFCNDATFIRFLSGLYVLRQTSNESKSELGKYEVN